MDVQSIKEMAHRKSYWKTTFMALAGAAVSLALIAVVLTAMAGVDAVACSTVLVLCLVACLLVASGGFVCLWRDACITAGRADPFQLCADRVPTPGSLSRLGFRFLLGPALRPGDIVRVKSFAEIRQTLGADGTLDNLPFMNEMKTFCGMTFRVHRRIDKINDMRNKTGLRRMRNAVTLTGLRCSGADHDGCQAECQIIWKDAWLTRLPVGSPLTPQLQVRAKSAPCAAPCRAPDPNRVYVCQMTRLWEASQPMSRMDIRQDLRPLLSGNISLGGYALAMLTRIFNYVQKRRHGVGFPAMPPSSASGAALLPAVLPVEGQAVYVRSRDEIAGTLKNSRTRGLWFDHDMMRFCGQRAMVHKRVDRVIHEATGKMVVMKTPSIILDGVSATGEFLRINSQHEYAFWREVWLRPATEVSNRRAPSISSSQSHDQITHRDDRTAGLQL